MKKHNTRNLVECAVFAALMAVGAFIKIPTPIMPITFQSFFASLAGYLLGGKRGALSVLIYISLGLLGLPVFADGGGLSYILRPAFGYIIGLAASAFVTGALSRKQKNASLSILAAAGFAGMLTVYVIGITYFWLISSYYLKTTPELRILFINCFLMTLPGDVIMILLSSVMAKRLIPLVLKAECS